MLLNLAAFALTLLLTGTAAAQSLNPSDQFFDLIRQDHAAILVAIEKIESGLAAQRQQDFLFLEVLLVPHMKGEEVAFYPALVRATAGELAKQAAIQHQDAIEVLRAIMRMAPVDPNLPVQVARLKRMLQEHMKLEEEVIFKQAQQKLSDQHMQRIQVDFQTTRQISKKVYQGN